MSFSIYFLTQNINWTDKHFEQSWSLGPGSPRFKSWMSPSEFKAFGSGFYFYITFLRFIDIAVVYISNDSHPTIHLHFEARVYGSVGPRFMPRVSICPFLFHVYWEVSHPDDPEASPRSPVRSAHPTLAVFFVRSSCPSVHGLAHTAEGKIATVQKKKTMGFP